MKLADLDTRTVLHAVRQGAPYGTLNTRYPTKVITAALERELHAGHIDYGTSISSPWLTAKGEDALWIKNNTFYDDTTHPTSTDSCSDTVLPHQSKDERDD